MKYIAFVSIIVGVVFSSCYKEEIVFPGDGIDGWDNATHSSSATPNYNLVFSDNQVNRLDITIDADDWDTMQDDLESIYGSSNTRMGPPDGQDAGGGSDFSDQTPVYIPCDVVFNGVPWYHVGIRYKGNSSLSAYSSEVKKLPFRMEFSEFEEDYPEISGQTFNGFPALSLSSNYNDKSFVREKMGCDLFREFGVPAPYASMYELYIDYGDGPVYYGVYTVLEIAFETMLKKQFNSDYGNCYKPDGDGAAFSSSNFSLDVFENKTNGGTGGPDIQALYDILHSSTRLSDTTSWKTQMESVFDVDGFLKWLAVNTTIQNWDTYGLMTHNYYLYHDPSDDLIKWIPWDNNEAFEEGKMGGALSYEFTEISSDDWPMIKNVLSVSGYEQQFKSHINDFISNEFDPTKMATAYSELESLLQNSVANETSEYSFLTSSAEFSTDISTLKTHASTRNSVAKSYIGN